MQATMLDVMGKRRFFPTKVHGLYTGKKRRRRKMESLEFSSILSDADDLEGEE